MKRFLPIVLLGLSVSALSIFGAMKLLAQQPDSESASSRPHPRWFTVHDYGVQIKLEPVQPLGASFRLQVIDLGPDVDRLRQDLKPTDARLTVSGRGSHQLQVDRNGVLSLEIPQQWLFSKPQAQLTVHSGSKLLARINVSEFLL